MTRRGKKLGEGGDGFRYIYFRGGLSPRFSLRFGGRRKAFRLRGSGGEGDTVEGDLLALRFIWPGGCSEEGGWGWSGVMTLTGIIWVGWGNGVGGWGVVILVTQGGLRYIT